MFLRHLLAFLALPFVAAGIVPIVIARRNGISFHNVRGALDIVTVALGVVTLSVGAALFVASVVLFASRGRGTLAPWDPPTRLVVTGPYRYVRNPMISGVLFVIAGEALVLRSVPHAIWAVLFAVVNLIYIPLSEEPGLEARFGEDYREYCRHVSRIWPRITPWQSPARARRAGEGQ